MQSCAARMSCLPACMIILHILTSMLQSFLFFPKHTDVHSNGWQGIWCLVPAMHFTAQSIGHEHSMKEARERKICCVCCTESCLLQQGGFANGHPPLFPAKAPCRAPAAYLMSPSYSASQRAWSPQHMSPGMYSTPDSRAAAALEGQVVSFRSEQAQRSERIAAQNGHLVTVQTGRSRRGSPQSAQPPMYSSSSGPAESAFAFAQRSAAEKLHPPMVRPDLGRQGSMLPAQPDMHASSTAAWEFAASAAEQQPLPAFAFSSQQEMPAAAQSMPFIQSTWQSALQGSSAAPSQFAANAQQPPPAVGPAMQCVSPSARQVQQSGAPELHSWDAAQQEDMRGITQSWKPLYTVPEEAQLQPGLLIGDKAPKAAQQDAPKSSMAAKRKHDGVKDSEGGALRQDQLPAGTSSTLSLLTWVLFTPRLPFAVTGQQCADAAISYHI